MAQKLKTQTGFYIGQWGALGWAETIIKLGAHILALIALLYALLYGSYTIPQGWRFIQVMILGFLSFGLTIAFFDRIIQREIISIIFGIVNAIAHWSMVYALMTQPGPGWTLPLFALLMLIGDLIKLRFFALTNYITHTYPGVPVWLPYFLVSVYVVGYGILVMLGFAGV